MQVNPYLLVLAFTHYHCCSLPVPAYLCMTHSSVHQLTIGNLSFSLTIVLTNNISCIFLFLNYSTAALSVLFCECACMHIFHLRNLYTVTKNVLTGQNNSNLQHRYSNETIQYIFNLTQRLASWCLFLAKPSQNPPQLSARSRDLSVIYQHMHLTCVY